MALFLECLDQCTLLYKKNENWTPFVYIRVSEIRSLSDLWKWQFIPGYLNPADLPSRDCTVEVLAQDNWWEGPQWLRETNKRVAKIRNLPKFWYFSCRIYKCNYQCKQFIKLYLFVPTGQIHIQISSYDKLVKPIAQIYRFYKNCKKVKEDWDTTF